MFCEVTTTDGSNACDTNSVGGQLDSALNFAAFAPGYDPTRVLEGITVGEMLSLLNEAVFVVKTADWTEVINELISSGLASDPAFSDALDLLRQFEAGDFSIFDHAVDVSTRALAPFPPIH